MRQDVEAVQPETRAIACWFSNLCYSLNQEVLSRLKGALDNVEVPSGDARDAILRQVYWFVPDIEPHWIVHAFGITWDEYHRIVENSENKTFCTGCGRMVPMVMKDREDRDRIWQMELYCPECTGLREEQRVLRGMAQRHALLEERIAVLRKMPYQDYLRSLEWQERRKVALEAAGHRCQTCNRDGPLDVHHRTYERRGCELPDDLTVLCRPCHETFHASRQLAPIGQESAT